MSVFFSVRTRSPARLKIRIVHVSGRLMNRMIRLNWFSS